MSLRVKIAIILAAVVLIYAAVDHVVQRTLIFDSFVELERVQARQNLRRAVQAIENEVAHLDGDCAASAASDETLRFVAGELLSLNELVLPQALRDEKLGLLYMCDAKGRVVWGSAHHPVSGEPLTLRDFPRQSLAPSHPLMPSPNRESIAGVVMTEAGPLLVSSRAITGSEPGAPASGTLIMGAWLDERMTGRLAQQCGVRFSAWAMDAKEAPQDLLDVRNDLADSPEPIVTTLDDDRLSAATTMNDVRGLPVLAVRAEQHRDVTASGARAVQYAMTSTVAAGLLLLLVLLNVLQRAVVKPLDALTHHAVESGRNEDFTKRLKIQRPDEIGILGREFDGLLERVESSRAAMVKAARAAGMSEIATGVLHNVGNVLNSVNVSASLVSEQLRGATHGDLAKVVRALEPHAADLPGFLTRDPKGKHLLPLLRSISEQLEAENQRAQKEIGTLLEGIEHVKHLVKTQQGYAGRSGVLEVASVSAQVDAALSFAEKAASTRGKKVEVVREYENLAPYRIDRHRLMEILVNLIQNAYQATAEAAEQPRIVLRVRARNGSALIEVEDNGTGIAPENIARIFTHGFTTKKNGHGFGLHSSANAAREMGGSLIARSEGLGKGATFVIELPMQTAESRGVAA